MEDRTEPRSPVGPVPESPELVVSVEKQGSPVVSKIGAAFVGFFSGAACMGTAWFATGHRGPLPAGLSLSNLGALGLLSVVIGALALRKWKGALVVQLVASLPYVPLLMLSEHQLVDALWYPVALWGTSALGMYIGFKAGALANAA
jgi:purine-cytosine permease-like protein